MEASTGLIIGTIVVAGFVGYAYIRSQQKKRESIININEVPTETTDNEVKLDDIVGLFKQMRLDKQVDTPFIALDIEETFGRELGPKEALHKEGYKTLFIGVLNNDKYVKFARIIYARMLDSKLTDLFKNSNDNMVILN